jgi:hydrogenase-4 component B
MTLAAVACVLIAVVPALVAPAMRRVLGALPAAQAVPFTDFGAVIRLPGIAGSIAPGIIAAALLIAILAAVVLSCWRSRRRPAAEVLPLWACGADELTPRMQYTATSFAEPLQRVFDDVLRPDTDIEVTPFAESHYMVERVKYRNRIGDAIEDWLYRPVVQAVAVIAGLARRAHTGSIHLYLAYGALGVLIMLVVAK